MKDRDRTRRAGGQAAALLSSLRGFARSMGGGRKRRNHELELVRNSSLFDGEWYLRAYPDVAAARIDPLQHYMSSGWREGRDPGPDFATSSYLKANRDVAAAGMNPLLHFVEFGQQEGRGSSSHRPAPRPVKTKAAPLREAAACASFPLPDEPPIRWRRGYQLPGSATLFSAGDCIAGYVDEKVREKLEAAFSLLAQLSGCGDGARAKRAQLPRGEDRLLDAWYVNSAQLRTRWRGAAFPLVVRVFQHDPLRDGRISLVGEGLAASSLDVVDLHLANSFFPVLLVFAEPDGSVRGARLLAFPSLCRGGVHYSELVHASAASAAEVDAMAIGELLAGRLLDLAGASASPAVGRIEVEIGDGDGRGQMFQPDFQLWLAKVLKVSVAAAGAATSRSAKFLSEAVAVPALAPSRRGGATLRIGHDMVPTISALVEPQAAGEAAVAEAVVPFIVAEPDPSYPGIEVEFPSAELPIIGGGSGAPWPQLLAGSEPALPNAFPAAAIAPSAAREMADAALLVPIANAKEPTAARPAITWVMETEGWADGGLVQALHALSLQTGAGGDCVSFVGAPDHLVQAVGRERMAGAVSCFDSVEAAVAAAATPVVGFVGTGVLLQDRRTAGLLTALLEDERVATASCAVIDVHRSGGAWHATIADGGSFVAPPKTTLGAAERDALIAFLWGSAYAVALPGPQLWAARKPSVEAWLKRSRRHVEKGLHVCTSEVSASQVNGNSTAQVPSYVPKAADADATRVRALFG